MNNCAAKNGELPGLSIMQEEITSALGSDCSKQVYVKLGPHENKIKKRKLCSYISLHV